MSQQALLQKEIGKPLVLESRPIPEPPANHVLVKVTVAGINPHDQKSRDWGLFTKDALPAVLANDVVGEIVKLGPSGTGDLQIGDHVFAQSNLQLGADHGGLQQYALLEATYLSQVPSNITDDEAGTIPTNAIAAYVAMFDKSGLGLPVPSTPSASSFDFSAQTLLIIGGGSNCGKFGVQLAKWAGIGRIIVVAGAANSTQLKSFGATDVIDRHAPDVLAEIKKLVDDELVYVFDAINKGADLTPAVAALSDSKKGTVASLLPGKADEAKIGAKTAGYALRQIFGTSWAHPEAGGLFWRTFMQSWIEKGDLTPLDYEVVDGLDADKVNAVCDNYKQGKSQSKVHVHPNKRARSAL